jgi:hypothetical protein
MNLQKLANTVYGTKKPVSFKVQVVAGTELNLMDDGLHLFNPTRNDIVTAVELAKTKRIANVYIHN